MTHTKPKGTSRTEKTRETTKYPLRPLALATGGLALSAAALLAVTEPGHATASSGPGTSGAGHLTRQQAAPHGEPASRQAPAAGTGIGVKPGWGTARVRLKPEKDAYIVFELKEGGTTAHCTLTGCGTFNGDTVTACNTTTNQWYPVTVNRQMMYVSATCGTPV
ncbi:hypothetical protein [Streptomyces cadmiisoli]|uniref:hypothetical protein n=1 Tax=Streptomyces cadmiisoli TaxID=2184053 RepID=UPI003655888B